MSVTFKCDNGDLILDNRGRFVAIDGIHKCSQDIAEALLNKWDPDVNQWYNGSELYLVDADPASLNIVSAEERIRYAVQDAILRLQSLQEDIDFVNETEKIEELRELWVDRIGDFTYAFRLQVVTESEDYVPLETFTIDLEHQLPTGLDAVGLSNIVIPYKDQSPYA
jgi:hypothetical protein